MPRCSRIYLSDLQIIILVLGVQIAFLLILASLVIPLLAGLPWGRSHDRAERVRASILRRRTHKAVL